LAHSSALQCTVAYNRHGGYCVPWSSRHRPAAQRILAQDVYEPDTIEFMCARCGDGDVVHAGTFFGDFLPALSKAVAPGARILAFEPNTENYRCARITMEINECANITLHHAALGASTGYLLLRTSDADGVPLGGASHVVAHDPDETGALEPVQVLRLDETADTARPISLIQLDVEGYEREALAGALTSIRKWRPVIILEVWAHSPLLESDWFRDNILSLGYRRTRNLHGNAVLECPTANPGYA
jgi:FkbM family methyltransferase